MQARVVSVRFDAGIGAWEARVDVERDGRSFRYPCRLSAPESVGRDWLDAALTRQAVAMSDTVRAPAAAAPMGLLRQLAQALGPLLHPRRAPSGIPVRASDPRRPPARA